MDISVIIPTRGRPDRLRTCLQRLARQSMPGGRYEVLVGFDGPDEAGPSLAQQSWVEAGGSRGALKLLVCPRGGLAAVRNALIPFATGRLLLSLNDDLLAEPQLLSEHVRTHEEVGSLAVVTGDAPWVARQKQSVFDVMLEQTSMVFFYNRMRGTSAGSHAQHGPGKLHHDWGFRHAWGLNMSMPTEAARRVGGFTQYPSWYGYEDNEIAFKLKERFGSCPVLFAPRAVGWHDHAMTPREYILREYKLGFASLGFTRTSPACSFAMFRRDIAGEDEQTKCQSIASENEQAARELLPWFDELANVPAPAAIAAAVVQAHYDKHLLLKRWAWNLGLADAFSASNTAIGEVAVHGDVDATRMLAVVGV